MIRAVTIYREIVALQYVEEDGKIVPGNLRIFPVGVWKNILNNEEIH